MMATTDWPPADLWQGFSWVGALWAVASVVAWLGAGYGLGWLQWWLAGRLSAQYRSLSLDPVTAILLGVFGVLGVYSTARSLTLTQPLVLWLGVLIGALLTATSPKEREACTAKTGRGGVPAWVWTALGVALVAGVWSGSRLVAGRASFLNSDYVFHSLVTAAVHHTGQETWAYRSVFLDGTFDRISYHFVEMWLGSLDMALTGRLAYSANLLTVIPLLTTLAVLAGWQAVTGRPSGSDQTLRWPRGYRLIAVVLVGLAVSLPLAPEGVYTLISKGLGGFDLRPYQQPKVSLIHVFALWWVGAWGRNQHYSVARLAPLLMVNVLIVPGVLGLAAWQGLAAQWGRPLRTWPWRVYGLLIGYALLALGLHLSGAGATDGNVAGQCPAPPPMGKLVVDYLYLHSRAPAEYLTPYVELLTTTLRNNLSLVLSILPLGVMALHPGAGVVGVAALLWLGKGPVADTLPAPLAMLVLGAGLAGLLYLTGVGRRVELLWVMLALIHIPATLAAHLLMAIHEDAQQGAIYLHVLWVAAALITVAGLARVGEGRGMVTHSPTITPARATLDRLRPWAIGLAVLSLGLTLTLRREATTLSAKAARYMPDDAQYRAAAAALDSLGPGPTLRLAIITGRTVLPYPSDVTPGLGIIRYRDQISVNLLDLYEARQVLWSGLGRSRQLRQEPFYGFTCEAITPETFSPALVAKWQNRFLREKAIELVAFGDRQVFEQALRDGVLTGLHYRTFPSAMRPELLVVIVGPADAS